MALLFMDSFDHYATADFAKKYDTTLGGGFLAIDSSNGRRSGGCGWFRSTAECRKVVSSSGSTAIIGFAIKITNYPNATTNFLNLYSGSTSQVSLALTTVGAIIAKNGGVVGDNSGSVLGTSTGFLALSTYYYIEVKFTLNDTTGSIEIKKDGVSILSLSSVDTNNAASLWTHVCIGVGSSTGFYLDDYYVCDGSGSSPWNNFLGDVRVDARLPTGAGATTGWTPLSGTNWSNVDDATPDSDTTYVSTATSPITDTYVTQDAPVVGAIIYGVQTNILAKKSDSGTCLIAPVIRHSSVDYPGTAQSPSTSYICLSTPYQTNPGTSAAWTEAGFNAAEFGIKRTA